MFELAEDGSGLTLVELAAGVTVEDIESRTEAPFTVAKGLG